MPYVTVGTENSAPIELYYEDHGSGQPVVLIHGGFGQGSDWFTTPDGRRGWASLFLEQGYKVYVLDRPGQGRGTSSGPPTLVRWCSIRVLSNRLRPVVTSGVSR